MRDFHYRILGAGSSFIKGNPQFDSGECHVIAGVSGKVMCQYALVLICMSICILFGKRSTERACSVSDDWLLPLEGRNLHKRKHHIWSKGSTRANLSVFQHISKGVYLKLILEYLSAKHVYQRQESNS